MKPTSRNLATGSQVGVIGMGVMGCPMACSLLEAGLSIGVFNRTIEKCEPARKLGARVATSPAELAVESDFIIVMLADDSAVEEIVSGNQGILAAGQEGLIVLNCSTVHPQTNQQLSEKLASRKMTLLDAPVTGSRLQAVSGQLYFLVSGDYGAYQKSLPLLDTMGRGHLYLGSVGNGACAKLANNLMGFINLAGLAEALELVTRFGLQPEKFLEVLSQSGGRSAVSEAKGPKILNKDWSPDFALKLAAKDLRLAHRLAKATGQQIPVLNQTMTLYSEAETDFGTGDVCSLIRWYRQQDSCKKAD